MKDGESEDTPVVQPLTYVHPVGKHPTMCLHVNKSDALVVDYKQPTEKTLYNSAKMWVLGEIYAAINANEQQVVYSHEVK
jgi:hypothetical protein